MYVPGEDHFDDSFEITAVNNLIPFTQFSRLPKALSGYFNDMVFLLHEFMHILRMQFQN